MSEKPSGSCTPITAGHVCVTSYGAWLDDCAARRKRGEKQLHCGMCSKWRWPGECAHGPEHMSTARQFNAMLKRVEREVRRRYPSQEDRYRRDVRAARARGELDS